MFDWLLAHAEAVGLVLQGGFFFIAWIMHRSFASQGDLKKLTEVIDGKFVKSAEEMKTIAAAHTATAGQLQLLTQRVDSMPSATDMSEIRVSMERMAGDYKALSSTVTNVDNHIKSIGLSVRRIEGYMMNGKVEQA